MRKIKYAMSAISYFAIKGVTELKGIPASPMIQEPAVTADKISFLALYNTIIVLTLTTLVHLL